MHWREFLDTAQRLVGGITEGDWRSGVSRAYYAVFHALREWLLAYGLDIGKGGSAHSNLYVGLNNSGITAISNIAARLDYLRSDRIDADYDLSCTFDAVKTAKIVAEASAIMTDFQALLATIPPRQIADGAKNYLISIGRIPKKP